MGSKPFTVPVASTVATTNASGGPAASGVFSSPCDGVYWDSSRRGWIAVPIVVPTTNGSTPPPDVFAPAVYGMEGAKLEAIRRRKAMEAGMAEQVRAEGATPSAAPAVASSRFSTMVAGGTASFMVPPVAVQHSANPSIPTPPCVVTAGMQASPPPQAAASLAHQPPQAPHPPKRVVPTSQLVQRSSSSASVPTGASSRAARAGASGGTPSHSPSQSTRMCGGIVGACSTRARAVPQRSMSGGVLARSREGSVALNSRDPSPATGRQQMSPVPRQRPNSPGLRVTRSGSSPTTQMHRSAGNRPDNGCTASPNGIQTKDQSNTGPARSAREYVRPSQSQVNSSATSTCSSATSRMRSGETSRGTLTGSPARRRKNSPPGNPSSALTLGTLPSPFSAPQGAQMQQRARSNERHPSSDAAKHRSSEHKQTEAYAQVVKLWKKLEEVQAQSQRQMQMLRQENEQLHARIVELEGSAVPRLMRPGAEDTDQVPLQAPRRNPEETSTFSNGWTWPTGVGLVENRVQAMGEGSPS